MKNYRQSGNHHSSTFSLGVLDNYQEPNSSNVSNSSMGDLNSLCSEPVKMFDFDTAFKNGFGLQGQEFNSISLSDLGFAANGDLLIQATEDGEGLVPHNPQSLITVTKEAVGSEVTAGGPVECNKPNPSTNARSDSPILEGIDQELAKYAKLKDLKQVYKSSPSPPLPPPPITGHQHLSDCDQQLHQTATTPSPPPPPLSCEPLKSKSQLHHHNASPPPTVDQPQQLELNLLEGSSLSSPVHSQSSRPTPDGASNPELNNKKGAHYKTLQQHTNPHKVSEENFLTQRVKSCGSSASSGGSSSSPGPPGSRRSPGTGQSSCGSDLDEERGRNGIYHDYTSQKGHELWKKNGQQQALSPIQQDSPVDKAAEGVQNKKSEQASLLTKAPKFSRLFSSAKKISKSPLKIVSSSSSPEGGSKNRQKGSEKPKRSTSSGLRSPAFLRRNKGSSSGGSTENSKALDKAKDITNSSNQNLRGNDKPSKKGSSSLGSGVNNVKASKNAKGTSSSEKCFNNKKPNNSSSNSIALISNKSGKKTCSSYKRQQQNHRIPSPYSFLPEASRASSRRNHNKDETSSNDSGIHNEQSVRLRPAHNGCITGDNSSKSKSGGRGAHNYCQSSQNVRAKHCKSSGYESYGLEGSERDSLESPTYAVSPVCEEPKEQTTCLTLSKDLGQLPPLPILQYGHDYVRKLDGRWRCDQYLRLKAAQEKLKNEMFRAKSNIGSDPKRWSYELHVEDNFFANEPGKAEKADPLAFVEALGKETEILAKRVDACKSHVRLMTCFDVNRTLAFDKGREGQKEGQMSKKMLENCCTTDCDPAENIVLQLEEETQETEII